MSEELTKVLRERAAQGQGPRTGGLKPSPDMQIARLEAAVENLKALHYNDIGLLRVEVRELLRQVRALEEAVRGGR
jgi:hypothetical protein